jgi:trehalose synthase
MVSTAGVWYTAYPSSTLTKPNQSILQSYGDKELWATFKDLGIKAIHTGPIKRSGSVNGKNYEETIDGWFDRISLSIDPNFGTDEDFEKLTQVAKGVGAIILGDIVPGHTGKGPDFVLATMNYKNYPGLYTMVEIAPEDWDILPTVPDGVDSINVPFEAVIRLTEMGYLPGRLQRVLFSVPGDIPRSGWDTTNVVLGVDGIPRRWVYLHYFKPGQPTLNWLDPTFAANQIMAADIIQTLQSGAKMLRLDANPFLGIEKNVNGTLTKSEGTVLSVQSSNQIAWLIRKLGGWSFQELNLGLDEVKSFSEHGADLSYDFVTRPAYQHALLTGDTSFLKLVIKEMARYHIEPMTLIHALQNHDEITYELVHFLTHHNEIFDFKGKKLSGGEIRDFIVKEMQSIAIGVETPYNRLSGNGLCATHVGLAAAALRITNPWSMTTEQKDLVKRGQILMALFNAMQPGVFAVSGWDLVGALPLRHEDVESLVEKDGDFRWLNRGAFDLMGDSGANKSQIGKTGLPRAECLFGSLTEQLRHPDSYASHLKHIINVRLKSHISFGKAHSLLETPDEVIAVMYVRPDNRYQISLLNFGLKPITGVLRVEESLAGYNILEILSLQILGQVSSTGTFNYVLDDWEGKVLVFVAVEDTPSFLHEVELKTAPNSPMNFF